MLPQEAVEVAHDRIVAIGRSRHGIGKAVAILMLDRASTLGRKFGYLSWMRLRFPSREGLGVGWLSTERGRVFLLCSTSLFLLKVGLGAGGQGCQSWRCGGVRQGIVAKQQGKAAG